MADLALDLANAPVDNMPEFVRRVAALACRDFKENSARPGKAFRSGRNILLAVNAMPYRVMHKTFGELIYQETLQACWDAK